MKKALTEDEKFAVPESTFDANVFVTANKLSIKIMLSDLV